MQKDLVIGGLAAIFMYNLLLIVPEFVFMLIVMLASALAFAHLNFSSHRLAPLFGMAFTTTLLIFGGATMPFSDGAHNAFISRIAAILIVVLYFVVVLTFIRMITRSDMKIAGAKQV